MKHVGVVIFLLVSLAVGVGIGLGVKQWMRKPASVPETPIPGALPKFRGFSVHLTGAVPTEKVAGAFEAMVTVHATAVLIVADVRHDTTIGAVVKEAQARKLQVFLAHRSAAERNATPVASAAAYVEQMKALAAAAKSLNVYGVCVGLGADVAMGDDDYWKGLFKTLRGIAPKARYVFVCTPDDYPSIGWWDEVDIIGVGDGFALPPKEHAEVDDLRNAWRKHLDELSSFASRLSRPAMIVDVGAKDKVAASQRTRQIQALLLEGRDRPELGGVILRGWSVTGAKDGLQAMSGTVEECWATPVATTKAGETLP